MGYYCTVPQCTSLAGKTKNVKFHRFPRDVPMADKWNEILKRGKPYTKYSKVCSLHFTQADYNVTTMGQWKTLSKDAVPSQNLPKLHPDGTVMIIRKSRTVKYRDGKKEECDESKKWQMPLPHHPVPLSSTPDVTMQEPENNVLAYRLQSLGHMTNLPQPLPHTIKPKKQDAIMQTDPIQNEDDDTQPNNSYSEVSEKSYSSEIDPYGYPKEDNGYPKDAYKESNYQKEFKDFQKDSFSKDDAGYQKDGSYSKDGSYQKDGGYQKDGSYQKDGGYQKEGSSSYQKDGSSGSYQKDTYKAKDYTKSSDDYIPQTNEEYNKEAEKYALERKSHTNGYDLKDLYQKQVLDGYQKLPDVYYDKTYMREPNPYMYQNGYPDSAELLRSQQHNLQLLHERQDQHRMENQNFFNENHIKQEIDITDDDKYLYERTKEQLDANQYNERRMQQQRLLDHIQQSVVKQEPENGGDSVMQPQGSPYPCYPTSHSNMPAGYYEPLPRPGPELLIAKQNALAAHTQLWQNTMKRPFFYSETPHYNGPQLLHRYEDLSRILQ